MTAGTWWQRLAGSFMPATLAQKWKIPVAVCTNEHPVVMVWVEHRTDSATNLARTFYRDFALEDDSGTDFRQYKSAAMAATQSGRLIGVPFPVAPATTRHLFFRVIYHELGTDRSYPATVKFVNPLFDGAARPMATHALPFSVTQNNVKVTLGGLRRWRASGYRDGPARRSTLLRCQISDLQDSNRKWSVSRFNIVGVRGAIHPLSIGRLRPNGEWDEYEIAAALGTNEVWNLQLELVGSDAGSNQTRKVYVNVRARPTR